MCRYFDGRHIFVVTLWCVAVVELLTAAMVVYEGLILYVYKSDGRLCVTFAFHLPCNDEENGKVLLYNFLYKYI